MRTTAKNLINTDSDTKSDWFRITAKKTAKAEPTSTLVYIYDEIGGWGISAQDFVLELMKIGTDQIELHINSPGGRIFDGVAIYQTLKAHPSEVIVIVDSLAASAASFIAQAGDKVIMTRNATMMIHDGIGLCLGCNEQEMHDTGNLLGKLSDNVASIYAERAGGTPEEWRALMRAEVWYDAREAVDAGLADEVDGDSATQDGNSNKWDLSLFNYAGRSQAPDPATIKQRVLLNRTKEVPVGKPGTQSATTDTTPEGTDTTTPEGKSDEGAPTNATTTPTTTTTTPVTPAGTSAEATGTETQPVNKGGVIQFTLNGSQTETDPAKVQSHITMLETFRQETITNTRNTFVESLAEGNSPKILAAKIDEVKEFAAGLSPTQYEQWKASWEAVGPISLLQPHAGGVVNPGGTPEAKGDEVDILEGIIEQHRLAGMPQDKIEQTASFKKLQELKSKSA